MTFSGDKLFIFDTNVLISAALIKNSQTENALNKAIESGLLAFSRSTLNELIEILKRPKFERYLSEVERQEFLKKILSVSLIFSPSRKFEICRDPRDNIFLDLIFESQADYLITGDQDLLVLNSFESAKIILPSDFSGLQLG
jgi:uncharacterized protein